jgi:hypothetical protein
MCNFSLLFEKKKVKFFFVNLVLSNCFVKMILFVWLIVLTGVMLDNKVFIVRVERYASFSIDFVVLYLIQGRLYFFVHSC